MNKRTAIHERGYPFRTFPDLTLPVIPSRYHQTKYMKIAFILASNLHRVFTATLPLVPSLGLARYQNIRLPDNPLHSVALSCTQLH
jgi:hypothetical protein